MKRERIIFAVRQGDVSIEIGFDVKPTTLFDLKDAVVALHALKGEVQEEIARIESNQPGAIKRVEPMSLSRNAMGHLLLNGVLVGEPIKPL